MVYKIRKVHRLLSMPMLFLVIANVVTREMTVNTYIEPITAAYMVLMTITGTFLFIKTRRKKGIS